MSDLNSSDIKKTAQDYRDLAEDGIYVLLPRVEKRLREAAERGAPASLLLALQAEREKVKTKINECLDEAMRLDLISIANSMDTDVDKAASAALKCSKGKVKLAIMRIEETKKNLAILALFLELGAALAAAAATGDIANIAVIIEKVDELVRSEFESILTPEELAGLSDDLKSCLR
jgi:hypothetical protein